MPNERVLQLIERRLTALGWSERKACLKAGLNVDSIRRMRQRGHVLRAEALARLADAMQVPRATMMEAAAADAGVPRAAAPAVRGLAIVEVSGHIQAGDWREAFEWPQGDRYPITIVDDGRHPGMQPLALEVRGDSMDQVYPDGSIVIVIRYGDLGRHPASGERIVVLRRDRAGQYEATLKEYQLDQQGRHWLLPKSANPEHRPILLGRDPLTADLAEAVPREPMPAVARASGFDDGAEPDVILFGLVVQSIRLE